MLNGGVSHDHKSEYYVKKQILHVSIPLKLLFTPQFFRIFRIKTAVIQHKLGIMHIIMLT